MHFCRKYCVYLIAAGSLHFKKLEEDLLLLKGASRIRNKKEIDELGTIKGSIWIPICDEVDERSPELFQKRATEEIHLFVEKLKRYGVHKNSNLVLICSTGARTQIINETLYTFSLHDNILIYEKGVQEWEMDGKEIYFPDENYYDFYKIH